jgi:DNA-binding CsgD family transcriptional regulator
LVLWNTNGEIALPLATSEHTPNFQPKRVFAPFHLMKRQQAVAHALPNGPGLIPGPWR